MQDITRPTVRLSTRECFTERRETLNGLCERFYTVAVNVGAEETAYHSRCVRDGLYSSCGITMCDNGTDQVPIEIECEIEVLTYKENVNISDIVHSSTYMVLQVSTYPCQ